MNAARDEIANNSAKIARGGHFLNVRKTGNFGQQTAIVRNFRKEENAGVASLARPHDCYFRTSSDRNANGDGVLFNFLGYTRSRTGFTFVRCR